MTKSKILIVSLAGVFTLAVLGLGGIFAFKAVQAAASTGSFPPLIQNLITKFNLDPTQVQQVITDTQTQQLSSRLDQAVANKQITADQKTLILNKIASVQQQIAAINNQQLTASDRQTQLQQIRTDLSTWATSNNIPSRLVLLGLGGKVGLSGGMRGGMGMMNW